MTHVWVKMHDVPIVAYFETGPSLISTKLRRPIMLDANTSNMIAESTKAYADKFMEVTRKKSKQSSKPKHIEGVRLTKPKPSSIYRPISRPAHGNGKASTSQLNTNKVSTDMLPDRIGKKLADEQELNLFSLKNSFDALSTEDNVFESNNDKGTKVEAPPKKTPMKTSIWLGRKVDSPKRNVAFSPETKVHYFDREDIKEVEHENAYSKKI
ncbi:hypothetical protein Tco_1367532 [Tanacetum coccineum]